jgi:hypothetical protein
MLMQVAVVLALASSFMLSLRLLQWQMPRVPNIESG